jgi:hypothetical protein
VTQSPAVASDIGSLTGNPLVWHATNAAMSCVLTGLAVAAMPLSPAWLNLVLKTMTSTRKSTESILRKEAVGFFFIIGLNWVVEIIQLPHMLYGDPAGFNWTRVLLRTTVVLAIWPGCT